MGGQAAQFAGGYGAYPQVWGQPGISRARRGPKNYARSDERISELVCERLVQEQSVDVSDVSVEVTNGRVTLDGTVPDRQTRHLIEDVVDGCWGVQDIENRIQVQSAQESGGMAGGQQGRISAASGGFASLSSGASGGKSGGTKGKEE
jgi:osmotically-inducible protein OsmY